MGMAHVFLTNSSIHTFTLNCIIAIIQRNGNRSAPSPRSDAREPAFRLVGHSHIPGVKTPPTVNVDGVFRDHHLGR